MFMSEVATTTVKDLIAHGLLRVVFQPIASLADGAIPAHEALIRGPVGSALDFPDALFCAADREQSCAALLKLRMHSGRAGACSIRGDSRPHIPESEWHGAGVSRTRMGPARINAVV